MIAYLEGKIIAKGLQYIILKNQGVGYKIFVTPDILNLHIGDMAELYTYHKTSDDGQFLYGLKDFSTLQFFELLITVSGVGPKVALGILSATKVDTVQQAIAHQDPEIFTRISGVGKKTAERIILELKNKLGALEGVVGNAGTSDVYDALIGLGYNTKEVRDILPKLDASQTAEQQLKSALKLLSK